MRLLIDTATFIWAVTSPDRISDRAMLEMKAEGAVREISVLSLAEVAIKQAIGKLKFSKATVREGIEELRLRVLPYTTPHAYQFFDLPMYHTDPFDRMIIAQALAEGIPVVTSDEKFRLYRNLEVVW